MIIEPNKTVEEYTVEFENDYQTILNHGIIQTLPQQMNTNQPFEIYTVYTDKTPVTASNSSIVIKPL